MAYLIRRGKKALYRQSRAHLAHYDPQGRIDRAWCGRTNFDLSSNVPWGLKVCKQCRQRLGGHS